MAGDVARLRELRDRVVADGFVVARSGTRHELSPIAIGPREGAALARWVEREGARSTLEVGLGYGIATLFICEGLLATGTPAHHVAIDPYQVAAGRGHSTRFEGIALEVLEDAGVRDLVEVHEQESQVVLPRLLEAGRSFDLAFIDGSHRFESVFLDLVYSGRLLKEGAIVFADDVQLAGVRKAADFCLANLGWSVEDQGSEGAEHAWLVLRTGRKDVFLRRYDQFTDF